MLGGFQVVITGLLAFAGKIWIDSLNESHRGQINTVLAKLRAELEATSLRLQAAPDRDLHVYKLQFEKEQKVYEAISDYYRRSRSLICRALRKTGV
jgi:hypothetical protein